MFLVKNVILECDTVVKCSHKMINTSNVIDKTIHSVVNKYTFLYIPLSTGSSVAMKASLPNPTSVHHIFS